MATSAECRHLWTAAEGAYRYRLSDWRTLTGGAALRVQTLDQTATIQQNDDFKLFNRLAKPHAEATVDERTEMNSVGGFLGETTNSETGVINPFRRTVLSDTSRLAATTTRTVGRAASS